MLSNEKLLVGLSEPLATLLRRASDIEPADPFDRFLRDASLKLLGSIAFAEHVASNNEPALMDWEAYRLALAKSCGVDTSSKRPAGSSEVERWLADAILHAVPIVTGYGGFDERLRPLYARARINLGVALGAANRWFDSIEHFAVAIEMLERSQESSRTDVAIDLARARSQLAIASWVCLEVDKFGPTFANLTALTCNVGNNEAFKEIRRTLDRIHAEFIRRRRMLGAFNNADEARRDVLRSQMELEEALADAEKLLPLPSAKPVPRIDDNVRFAVYRPKTIRPQKWYTLLAFAHLAERPLDVPPDEPDPNEEVRQQAQRLLGEQAKEYQDVTRDSKQPVPRNGEIVFVPEVPGIEFNPSSRSFVRQEAVHREEFRLRAPLELDGKTAQGEMLVYLEGTLLLARVPLAIRIDGAARSASPAVPLEMAAASSYQKIFASYSHKDSAIVQQFERFATALGNEFLRDVVHLRAGIPWNARLRELIEEADVFQLFWSSNSMESAYVRQEWEHALSLNRPCFIRPTYWETPLPASPERRLPPEELQRLHFHRLRLENAPPVPSGPSSVPPAGTETPRKRSRLEQFIIDRSVGPATAVESLIDDLAWHVAPAVLGDDDIATSPPQAIHATLVGSEGILSWRSGRRATGSPLEVRALVGDPAAVTIVTDPATQLPEVRVDAARLAKATTLSVYFVVNQGWDLDNDLDRELIILVRSEEPAKSARSVDLIRAGFLAHAWRQAIEVEHFTEEQLLALAALIWPRMRQLLEELDKGLPPKIHDDVTRCMTNLDARQQGVRERIEKLQKGP